MPSIRNGPSEVGILPSQSLTNEVGSPSVGECWRYGDDRGVQEAVTLSFGYTAGRHVVSLLLDHSCGGGIKNVWVGEAGDVLARSKVERAIAAGECPVQPDEFSNVASTRAILRARAALLARSEIG